MVLVMTTTQPWKTADWRQAGHRTRRAWKVLLRMGQDFYPLRVDFPPRISPDKFFRTSQPERQTIRLEEREEALQEKLGLKITRAAVERGREALAWEDYESSQALVLADVKNLPADECAGRLHTSRTRFYELLNDGWAYLAWRLAGHEA